MCVTTVVLIRISMHLSPVFNGVYVFSFRSAVPSKDSFCNFAHRPLIMWGNVVTTFFAIKCIQLAIVGLAPMRFDTSSSLVFEKYALDEVDFLNQCPRVFQSTVRLALNHILKKLVTWDTVYFADMFVNYPQFEHQFVFCPLWWRFVKYMPPASTNFYTKLLAAVAWTNLFHLLSCVSFYYLAASTLSKASMFRLRAKSIAIASTLAYIISPGGIFLVAPYSESFCNVLVITALWFREASLAKNVAVPSFKNVTSVLLYGASGLLIATAFGVRANSVLFGVFYLFDLYNSWKNSFHGDSIVAIFTGAQIAGAIAISIWYPYTKFCPERGEWCDNWIPSLFSYAQSKYWGVGFLKYWSANNIPNFLFAAPTLLLSTWASNYFMADYPTKQLLPHIAVTLLLCCGALFFWHVQILTRIASVTPLPYIYVGCLVTSPSALHRLWARYIILFFLLWIFLQAALFAAFLPPA